MNRQTYPLFGEYVATLAGFCDSCQGFIPSGEVVFYDGSWRICIPCSGLNKPNDLAETGGPEHD